MRWLLFLFCFVVFGALGIQFLSMNLLSECLPFYSDFEECRATQDRDTVLILVGTMALWIGSAFVIFRKKSS